MGFFNQKKTKVKFFDPAEFQEVRQWLLNLLNQPYEPAQREIAGLTPGERGRQTILEAILRDQGVPSELQTALDAALNVATGSTDLRESPFFAPLITEAEETGNEALNRMARKFNISGGLTSSPAGTALARGSTDLGKRILGVLAPYAEAAQQRQFQAIPLLANLSQMAQQIPYNVLDALSRYEPRNVEQQRYDEQFRQEHARTESPFTHGLNVAQTMFSRAPVAGVTGGGPSDFERALQIGAAILPLFAGGGAGAGAGAGAAAGARRNPYRQTSPYSYGNMNWNFMG
jgi:hypothetical protein